MSEVSIHTIAVRSFVWDAITVSELRQEWLDDDTLAVESVRYGERVDFAWAGSDAPASVVLTLADSRHGTDVKVTFPDAGMSEFWRGKLSELEAFLDRQDSI
jgi:uncharacterized protein YndB with AHSA1/START domain